MFNAVAAVTGMAGVVHSLIPSQSTFTRLFGYKPIDTKIQQLPPESAETKFLHQLKADVERLAGNLEVSTPQIEIRASARFMDGKNNCWCCGAGLKPISLFHPFRIVEGLPSAVGPATLLIDLETGHEKMTIFGLDFLMTKELLRIKESSTLIKTAAVGLTIFSLQGGVCTLISLPLLVALQRYSAKNEEELIQMAKEESDHYGPIGVEDYEHRAMKVRQYQCHPSVSRFESWVARTFYRKEPELE